MMTTYMFEEVKESTKLSFKHPLTGKKVNWTLTKSGGTSNPFNGFKSKMELHEDAINEINEELRAFFKILMELEDAIRYKHDDLILVNVLNNWNEFMKRNFRWQRLESKLITLDDLKMVTK